MTIRMFAAAGAAALMLASCQSIPADMSLTDYCADPGKANRDVCKVNAEIDSQRLALNQVNMSLAEARLVVNDALSRANAAQAAAARAQQAADAARQHTLTCETRTLNSTQVGTCAPGYKIVSCTQTRYSYSAGAPSMLREINDQECRFRDRVLEVQVRCCTAGPVPLLTPDS